MVGLLLVSAASAIAEHVDLLKVELKTENAGTSLRKGGPAWFEVKNTSKTMVSCDLYRLDDGVILQMSSSKKGLRRTPYSEGFVPSRRYAPTFIMAGETVKVPFSLRKLIPKLPPGKNKLYFDITISTIPMQPNREPLREGGGMERHQGSAELLITP